MAINFPTACKHCGHAIMVKLAIEPNDIPCEFNVYCGKCDKVSRFKIVEEDKHLRLE